MHFRHYRPKEAEVTTPSTLPLDPSLLVFFSCKEIHRLTCLSCHTDVLLPTYIVCYWTYHKANTNNYSEVLLENLPHQKRGLRTVALVWCFLPLVLSHIVELHESCPFVSLALEPQAMRICRANNTQ